MYLFLSLLQARVGSSLVSHLGNLAPEAVLRTPVAELAGRAKISERASRAFEEVQRAFDPGLMQERLVAKSIDDGHRDGQGSRARALRAGRVRGERARARGGCGSARGSGRGRWPHGWRTRLRHRRYVSYKTQTAQS